MITLVCKDSGFKVKGLFIATTMDHYILEINGITQMFRIGEWEEVRDADQSIS